MPDVKKQLDADKQIKKVEELCSMRGYKFSVQRKKVLYQLIITDKYIDAESLWLSVIEHTHMSLASVYNTLKWLETCGFLKRNNAEKKSLFKYESKAI